MASTATLPAPSLQEESERHVPPTGHCLATPEAWLPHWCHSEKPARFCPLVMSSLGSFPTVQRSSRRLVPASEAPCQRPIQESSSLAAARPQEAKANGHFSGQYRPDSRWNASLPPGSSGVYDMARRPSRHPLCRQPRGGSHHQ